MMRAGVVLFENWMMDYRGRHSGSEFRREAGIHSIMIFRLKTVLQTPDSISHTGWRRIIELLRLRRIQSLQDCVFRLCARFVLLLDVNKSQIEVRGRVIVLEP